MSDPAPLLRDLQYRRATGDFVWTVTKGRKRAGEVAGSPDRLGYRLIRIDGRLYLGHHLVWLAEHGRIPREIDHIDGNPSNNRIENLRECTRAENQRNVRRHRDNTSGYKGVYEQSRGKARWFAKVMQNGKQRHLGTFSTREEAARAYDAAACEIYGRFAKINGV